tara:strand:- start:296 stop:775 length:480 start_codon:yes stop_codon:yes gene_type:complete
MAAWHCRQHCALSLLALALLPLSAGQGVAPLLKAIDGNNPSQINMALKSTHPKLLKEVDATGTMPRQKRSPSAPGLAPSRCTQARLRWWCLEASSAAVSCWRRGVPRLASAFGAPACLPERLVPHALIGALIGERAWWRLTAVMSLLPAAASERMPRGS